MKAYQIDIKARWGKNNFVQVTLEETFKSLKAVRKKFKELVEEDIRDYKLTKKDYLLFDSTSLIRDMNNPNHLPDYYNLKTNKSISIIEIQK